MNLKNTSRQEQLAAFFELLIPIEAKSKSWFTQHGENFTIKDFLIEATPADPNSFAFRIADNVPGYIRKEIEEAREIIFQRYYVQK
ncbi:hypothetical protein I5M27_12915 [Adhaeribacter sp. BT258]|uniref:Uncharacterized protein n=1 Tax=Adhaeribacter terrigena TaxID=2793070 RepID=A0ABS1C3E8_9BACT|nr:hypothetical protein [Adhaeribacter terrigena]MBK0403889.1 hypothetical protein [Adhaeribacter terrigena]